MASVITVMDCVFCEAGDEILSMFYIGFSLCGIISPRV